MPVTFSLNKYVCEFSNMYRIFSIVLYKSLFFFLVGLICPFGCQIEGNAATHVYLMDSQVKCCHLDSYGTYMSHCLLTCRDIQQYMLD